MNWMSQLSSRLGMFRNRDAVSKGQHALDLVHLYVDRLEERRVLSASAVLLNDVLTITGDDGSVTADDVLLEVVNPGDALEQVRIFDRTTGSHVEIVGHPAGPGTTSIETGLLSRINIDLGADNDKLDLQIPSKPGGDALEIEVFDNDPLGLDEVTILDNSDGILPPGPRPTNTNIEVTADVIEFGPDPFFDIGQVDLIVNGDIVIAPFPVPGSLDVTFASLGSLEVNGDVIDGSDPLTTIQLSVSAAEVRVFGNIGSEELPFESLTITTDHFEFGGSAEPGGEEDGEAFGAIVTTGDQNFLTGPGPVASFNLTSNAFFHSDGSVTFGADVDAAGEVVVFALDTISLHDVTSVGDQFYVAEFVVTNSHYDTGGGDFLVIGDWDVQTSSSVFTQGGDIDLSGALVFTTNPGGDPEVNLQLDTGPDFPGATRDVLLGDFGLPVPPNPNAQLLSNVSILNARDVDLLGSSVSLTGTLSQSAGTGTTTLNEDINVAHLDIKNTNITVSDSANLDDVTGTVMLMADADAGEIRVNNEIGTVGSPVAAELSLAGFDVHLDHDIFTAAGLTLTGQVVLSQLLTTLSAGGGIDVDGSIVGAPGGGNVDVRFVGETDVAGLGDVKGFIGLDDLNSVPLIRNVEISGGSLTLDGLNIAGDLIIGAGTGGATVRTFGAHIRGTARLGDHLIVGDNALLADDLLIQNGIVLTTANDIIVGTGTGKAKVTGNVESEHPGGSNLEFDGITEVIGLVGADSLGSAPTINNLLLSGGSLTTDGLNIGGDLIVGAATGGAHVRTLGAKIAGTARLGDDLIVGDNAALADDLLIQNGIVLTTPGSDIIVGTGAGRANVTGDVAASGPASLRIQGETVVSGTVGVNDHLEHLSIENDGNGNGGSFTAGAINLDGTLTADQSVSTTALNGGISVDGDLVARAIIHSAAAIDIGGVSSIGADINSEGHQTYTGQMTLTANAQLTANKGSQLNLGLVDGGGFDLTLTTDGITTLGGNIANVGALASTSPGGGGQTVIDTAQIDAASIHIGEAVEVATSSSLTAPTSIVITGPIESAVGESNTLSLTSTGVAMTGLVDVQDNVGGKVALGEFHVMADTSISLHDVTTAAQNGESGDQLYDATTIITNSNYATGGGDFTMNGVWDIQSNSVVETDGGDILLQNATLSSSNVGISLLLDASDGVNPGGTVSLGQATNAAGELLGMLSILGEFAVFNSANFEVGSLNVDVNDTITLVDVTTTGDQVFEADTIAIGGTFATNGGMFIARGNGVDPVHFQLNDNVSITTTGGVDPTQQTIDLSDATLSATDIEHSLTLSAGTQSDVTIGGAGDRGGANEFVDNLIVLTAQDVTLGPDNFTINGTLDTFDTSTILLTGALLAGTICVVGDVVAASSVETNDTVEGFIDISGNFTAAGTVISESDLFVGGQATFGSDVTAENDSTIEVDGGGVVLTGDVTFLAGTVGITGDVTGDTADMVAENVTFQAETFISGTVGHNGVAQTNLNNLTIRGDSFEAGEVNIDGDLDSDQSVRTTDEGIAIGGTLTNLSTTVSAAGISIDGLTTIGDDLSAEDGLVDLNGGLLLTGDVVVTGTGIDIEGNVSGPHDLTLDSTTATSDVSGSIGNDLVNLTAQGGTLTAGEIDITGDLDADVAIVTVNGGISVDGNVDAASTLENQQGSLDVGGSLIAAGTIDSFDAITVVGTSQLGGDVTSGGEQIYQSAVTLTGNVHFQASDTLADADNLAVTFHSSLDAAGGGSSHASFTTNDDVLLTGAVGGITPLDSLTIHSAHDVTFQAPLTLVGDFVQTTGTGLTTFNGTAGAGVGGQLNVTTRNIDFASGLFDVVGTVDLNAVDSVSFSGGLLADGSLQSQAAISITADTNDDGTGGVSQSAGSTIETLDSVTILVGSAGAGVGNVNVATINAGLAAGIVTISTGGSIGEVIDNADVNITASAAALIAGTGIVLDTDLDTLAFDNAASAVEIINQGALVIDDVGLLTTSRGLGGGAVAAHSPLTIAMNTIVGGDFTFTAGNSNAAGDTLTIDADVTHVDGDGFIGFVAGDDIIQESGTIQNRGGTTNEVRFIADNEGAGIVDGDRGGMTQNGGSLDAGQVVLRAFDNVSFTQAANDVDTLAVSVTGIGATLSFTDSSALNLETVDGVSGITTNGGDVTLTTGGQLTIGDAAGTGQSLDAGIGHAFLDAAGIAQNVNATVQVTHLELQGTGDFVLDGANDVASLTADILGNLEFNDADASMNGLIVGERGPISAVTGVTTGDAATPTDGGHVMITSAGLLTIDEAIDTRAGTGGTVLVDSVILDATLFAGAGNITLNGGGNDLFITANQSTATDTTYSAKRDVIVQATVATTDGADLDIIADNDLDGSGGVRLTEAGFVNVDGSVLLQGSDLFQSVGPIDAVVIDADAGADQISAKSDIMLQRSGAAPLNADIVLNGQLQSMTGNVDITSGAGGSIRLGANIAADDGNVDFHSRVLVTNDATVSAAGTDGNITFDATVDDDGDGGTASNLVVRGTGETLFSQNVGTTAALQSLLVDGGGTTRLQGNVTVDDSVRIDDAVLVRNTVTVTAGAGGIHFDSTVDAEAPTADLKVVTTGNTRFHADIGSIAPLDRLDTESDGVTELNGNVTTSGQMRFADDVVLTSSQTWTTGAGADIRFFGDTLNSEAGEANTLDIQAGRSVLFFNTVGLGANGQLGALKITAANRVDILEAVRTIVGADAGENGSVTIINQGDLSISNGADLDLDGSFTQNGPGDVDLSANITTTNDDVTFSSAVQLGNNLTINTGAGDGNITFQDTLNGTSELTLTAGTGNVHFMGEIGDRLGFQGLRSLQVTSATDITIDESVFVSGGAGINLTSRDQVTILDDFLVFLGGVTIDNGGLLAIAANADLNSVGAFMQTGSGAVDLAGNIGTLGNEITFNGAVRLIGDNTVVLDTTSIGIANNADGATIRFGSTLDGEADCNENLTIDAGLTGDVVFTDAVGATEGFGTVIMTEAHDVEILATFVAAALTQNNGTGTTHNDGTITIKSAAGIDIKTQVIDINADIDVQSQADGAPIKLEAANGITVDGTLSSDTGTVTLDSRTDVTFGASTAGVINSVAGLIELTADKDITFGGTSHINSTTGDVKLVSDFDNDSDGTGGSITLNDGSSLNAGNATITLSADGNVTVSLLQTTNDTATAVVVTSKSAGIVDADMAAGLDIIANGNSAVTTLRTATGVGVANALETNVGQLDVLNSNSGKILIDEADGIDILRLQQDSLAAVDEVRLIANGTIRVLTDQSGVTANNAAIDVTLNALGANSDLNVAAAISTAGGNVDLDAGGDIAFTTNGVPIADDGNVTSNGGNITIDAGGSITQDDQLTIHAGLGTIALHAQGDVAIAHLVTANNTASAVSIKSQNGAIIDNGETGVDILANAVNAEVTLIANSGIGVAAPHGALETTLARLNADVQGNGGIAIQETDAAIVQQAMTANGSIVIDAAGNLTVNDGGAAGNAVDAMGGAVSLTTDANLMIESEVATDGGAIELLADGAIAFNTQGHVTSQDGNIRVSADHDQSGAGGIDQTDGLRIDAGSGTIALSGHDDIAIAHLTTTNSTDMAVSIVSRGGSILDNGDTDTEIVANTAAALVTLDAQTGVGSTNALDVQLHAVTVNTVTGNIQLIEQAAGGDLIALGINNDAGDINIDLLGGQLTLGDGNGQDITANGAGATVSLDATNGVLEMDNSTITATNLELLGAGTFTLNESNDVDTLAVDITGPLSFNDSDDLTVGTVDGTIGIDSAGNDVTLTTGAQLGIGDGAGQDITALGATVVLNTTSGGVLQQDNSVVVAANLELLGTGTFDLSETGNDVDVLAASVDGALTFNNADDLRIGSVNGTDGIFSNSNNVLLQAGGTLTIEQALDAGIADVRLNADSEVSQTETGTISANALGIVLMDAAAAGSQDIDLCEANTVNIFAARNHSAGGVIRFNNTGGFTVNTVAARTIGDATFEADDALGNDVVGVTTVNGEIELVSGGILTLAQTVDSTDSLADAADGDILLTATGALNVNAVLNAGFISSGNTGNIHLDAGGAITLTQAVRGNTVRMAATGTVSQSNTGTIFANSLGVRQRSAVAGTNIELGEDNTVSTFAAENVSSTGTVSLRSLVDLDVDSVAEIVADGKQPEFVEIVGITSTDGDVLLESTGTLTISRAIDAGAGDVRLLAEGDISQTEAGTIAADELGVRLLNVDGIADQNIELCEDNDVSTFAARNESAAGQIRFADVDDYSIGTVAQQAAGAINFPAVTGVQSNQGAIELASGAAMAVNNAIDATGADLFLSSDTTLTLAADLTADTLRLLADQTISQTAGIIAAASVGVRVLDANSLANQDIELNQANQIGIFAAENRSNGGTVRLTNNQALMIDAVTEGTGKGAAFVAVSGVSTSGGNVDVTAAGTIHSTLGNDVTTTTATQPAGDVSILATAGDIELRGDVAAVGAAGQDGGSVTIESQAGSVTLTNVDVSAGEDAGTVDVDAAGNLTLTGNLDAIGGNSDGTVDLNSGDSILDGNDGATIIHTGNLNLHAVNNIGQITDFAARTGDAIDVEVTGLMTGLSSTNAATTIHVRAVADAHTTGDLTAAAGAIEPGQNAAAQLLIQAAGSLDVGTQDSGNGLGAMMLSPGDTVGLHAADTLILPDGGLDVGTGLSGGTLRLSGGVDIVDAATTLDANDRVFGKLTAQDLFYTSGSAGMSNSIDGDNTLNVDITNLEIDLSSSPSGRSLTINNDNTLNANRIVTNDGSVRINNSLLVAGDLNVQEINVGTGNVTLDTSANGGRINDLGDGETDVIAQGLSLRTQESSPADGLIDDQLEVRVDVLAASTTGRGVKILDETGDLEIGTVVELGGTLLSGIMVNTADGDDVIDVSTAGGLNVTQDVTSAGDGTITLTAQSGDLSMGDGTTVSTNDEVITLNATGNVDVSMVSADADMTGDQGNVTIHADTDADNSGAITDNLDGEAVANVTANHASLMAASGIGSSDDLQTDVVSIDAQNSTDGNIRLFEIHGGGDNALTVDSISNQNGNIDVQTDDGELTIVGPVQTTNAGSITLVAGDELGDGNDDLRVQSTVTTDTGNIALTSAGNSVTFSADGDVTTTSGRVDVSAGETDDSGDIVQDAAAVIDAGDGQVELTAHGQITLGNITTTNASAAAVTLNADAGVENADPANADLINIDAANGRLIINASEGVGDDVADPDQTVRTTVAALDLQNATSGDIRIVESDDLEVVRLDQRALDGEIDLSTGGTLTISNDGLMAVDGSVNLTTKSGGTLTVTDSTVTTRDGELNVKSAGHVQLESTAGNSANIQTTNGDIEIVAGLGVSMDARSRIQTEAASVKIVADNALVDNTNVDGISMDDGAVISAVNATTDMVANGDVHIGQVMTENLRVSSSQGGVIDAGDTGGVDIAATHLGIDAQDGIGSDNALETSVQLLAAENDETGSIQIDNTGQNLLKIDRYTFGMLPEIVGISNTGTQGGSIAVTNLGAIEVVEPVTNSTTGDITLTADDGDANTTTDNLTVNAMISTAQQGGSISLKAGTDVVINQKVDTSTGTNELGNITIDAGRSIEVHAQLDAEVGTRTTVQDIKKNPGRDKNPNNGGVVELIAGSTIDIFDTGEDFDIDGSQVKVTTEDASLLPLFDLDGDGNATDVFDPTKPEFFNPNDKGDVHFDPDNPHDLARLPIQFVDNLDFAENKVVQDRVKVRSATGIVTQPIPSLRNVVTPQVTSEGIAEINGEFGRLNEEQFIFKIRWFHEPDAPKPDGHDDVLENRFGDDAVVSTQDFDSGEEILVFRETTGPQEVNQVFTIVPGADPLGGQPALFSFDYFYEQNPNEESPSAPILIEVQVMDDALITFQVDTTDLGVATQSSRADVPGEGLSGTIAFDVSIDAPPLEPTRTQFGGSRQEDTEEGGEEEQDDFTEGVVETETSRDELIMIIQKIGPDGKVAKDRFGRPIQQTRSGAEALKWLNNRPELFKRLDFGHWKIFTKDGDDAQMLLIDDVILRNGREFDGKEGTQDRPPTSEDTGPEEMESEGTESVDAAKDNLDPLTEFLDTSSKSVSGESNQPMPPEMTDDTAVSRRSEEDTPAWAMLAMVPASRQTASKVLRKVKSLRTFAGLLLGFLR